MSATTILLVDDNPAFRRIAARFLQLLPEVMVVDTASGGRDGLARAQALRPDVVLMDLHMNDLPGLEAIPRLRACLPEVGIIALTLMETSGYREAALAAGADEFVAKARMDTDLLPAIHRVRQAAHRQSIN
jgi:DNA-binding NarL/FixJ family response regulator